MGVRFTGKAWSDGQVVLVSDDGNRTVLVEGGSDGRLLPDGRLLFAREGVVMVVEVDADLRPVGTPVPVLEGVAQAYTSGMADLAVSASGTIVYAPGGIDLARTLVWVDRAGVEQPFSTPPHAYVYPRLSPDGRRVAVEIREDTQDLYILNVDRGTLLPLTTESDANYPVWLNDSELVFGMRVDDQVDIFRRRADGTGGFERLTSTATTDFPQALAEDGVLLTGSTPSLQAAQGQLRPGSGGAESWRRLRLIELAAPDANPRFLEENEFSQANGTISPDGSWVAYESTDTGGAEVYVRRLDGSGDRTLVSSAGGSWPLWSPAGDELFYVDRSTRDLVVVPVTPGPTLTLGQPRTLFSMAGYYSLTGRMYDTSDGQRFVIVKNDASSQRDRFVMLLDELPRLGTSR